MESKDLVNESTQQKVNSTLMSNLKNLVAGNDMSNI